MMETMLANQNPNHNNGGTGHSGEIGGDSYIARGAANLNCGYQIPTKVSRVEFPHFSGEDLRGWLYKCEQFFEVDETPSTAKVKLASVHLEGKALQWHQMYMKGRLTREIPNWEEYVRVLNDRFGALIYDDPILPYHYALSCFLGGLKSEISVNVRMFRPKSLQEAISLSKLQEQAILLSHKKTPLLSINPIQFHQNILTLSQFQNTHQSYITLTNKPHSELFKTSFWKSKEKKKMEESEEEGELEGELEEDTLTESHISMHAITGILDFKTMRVTGVTKGRLIHILIDTESTHNFMDLGTAKRLGCKLEPMTPFSVSVADGNKIHNSFMYRNFCWKMQGMKFSTDLMTTSL
ncbi:hypothetical protein BUALT_Bualt01G0120900 [Buddleja alternifolia]|uniref:Retrotransposon gag domain-containing protein n=1 Tax=Buddleja alternifolia TaxID=168488 RepID=A0AAV6YF13_9LAMI|nr:hypothetical protein BUALT_Bualt01G0120900 [Buddleja alternifolia]